MARSPLPPIAAAISFIDCVNRGDLGGLTELMTDSTRSSSSMSHRSSVAARTATPGSGYFSSFPDYVIHPRLITADGASVAVLGVTTGSHLGLPDEEEARLSVIWLAHVVDGRLSSWRVAADAPELRAQLGIPPTA